MTWTCGKTTNHGPHRVSNLGTSRMCPGVKLREVFCGDYAVHKSHASTTGNAVCPGLSKRRIAEEVSAVRYRLRCFGIVVPEAAIRRSMGTFRNIVDVFEEQQRLLKESAELVMNLTDELHEERSEGDAR